MMKSADLRRLSLLLLLLLTGLLAACAAESSPPPEASPAERPTLIMLFTDP